MLPVQYNGFDNLKLEWNEYVRTNIHAYITEKNNQYYYDDYDGYIKVKHTPSKEFVFYFH